MNISLCPYKDLNGKPSEGIHQYRIFDISIVDVSTIVIVAYIISLYFNTNFLYIFIIIFFLGIISHRIFCVRTTIDKILFP